MHTLTALTWCLPQLERRYHRNSIEQSCQATRLREAPSGRSKRTRTSPLMCQRAKTHSIRSASRMGPIRGGRRVWSSYGKRLLKRNLKRARTQTVIESPSFWLHSPSTPTRKSTICGGRRTRSSTSTGARLNGRSALNRSRRLRPKQAHQLQTRMRSCA